MRYRSSMEMTLSEYFDGERGRQAALAKALHAHAPDLSRMASGERPIPIPYGPKIEKETGGLVTRRKMFPDTWQELWPELTEAKLPE